MKVTTKSTVIVAVTLMIFLGFQNCAKVTFKTAAGMNGKLDDGVDNTVDDIGDDVTDDGGVPTPTPTATATPIVDDGGDNDDDSGDQEGAALYICVLKGSGDSHVLQYSDKLYDDTSKNKTVCTTERGCLEIASQLFEVDHVKQEGQRCAHAHSVIQIDEASLQGLVDAQKN